MDTFCKIYYFFSIEKPAQFCVTLRRENIGELDHLFIFLSFFQSTSGEEEEESGEEEEGEEANSAEEDNEVRYFLIAMVMIHVNACLAIW